MRLFTLPKRSQPRFGFTLIELMIAISIIAILSTIGVAFYTQGQKLARDTKRKQDLKQIQNALNLYYQDNKQYPAAGSSGGWVLSSSSAPWIATLGTNYIDKLPTDPVNTGTTKPTGSTTSYTYAYIINVGQTFDAGTYSFTKTATCDFGADNQFYILAAQLENSNDPQTIANKAQKICTSTLTGLSPAWNGSMYILMSKDY